MESETKDYRNKILEYCKSRNGELLTLDNLSATLNEPKRETKKEIQKLLSENILYAIPIKRHNRWYWYYYVKPNYQIPIKQRLEDIFKELAIPPYIDITLNRGFQVIFIGKYGSRPGFSIIDFSYDPPIVFKDNMYGGENDEITLYKQRSRYVCKKEGVEIWYNLHGQKMYVNI
jgi:hypothetical protein